MPREFAQKLKSHSSGMQMRSAFSPSTRARADILLMDEVLAVGDAEERVEKHLKIVAPKTTPGAG